MQITQNQKNPLQKVLELTLGFLTEYSQEKKLEQQLRQHQLLDALRKLDSSSFGLPSLSGCKAKIAERQIRTPLDSQGLRISLYFMPKGAIMPLHDHPEMIVISYIVEGHLQAHLYTPIQEQMTFEKEIIQLKSKEMTVIDGPRTMKHNLHQLIAKDNTLFLDIIFPDYDYQERQCTCFKEAKQMQTGRWKLQEVPCILDIDSL